MYKNVTLNTRKMAIPTARCTRLATDDAIIMTYINTQRSASKVHKNGLPGEDEI